MSKVATEPRTRGNTRLRLILAAEKLFGDKGIHGVTLKEINGAAGQRNESALHYHFGSKPALVQAIMAHRARDIDMRRVEMVDAVLAEGRDGDLPSVLRALFQPMTDMLNDPDGVRFVRFLAQVLNDPDFDLPDLALRGNLPGIKRGNQLLIAALADLPPEIAIQRQRSLIEMAVSSLAIWTRHHDGMGDVNERNLFVANLFDCLQGFVTAPVAENTIRLLQKVIRGNEKK